MKSAILFASAWLLCQSPLWASSLGRPRVTIQTRHFEITVDQNKSEILTEAAAWLENAYTLESKFFAFETSEPIQVVLLDEEDFSNGFAYPANGWIVIYLPPSRFAMRGTTQWFANVSAHELAHILTLRKMGLDSRFSGIDFFASWNSPNKSVDGDVAWIPKNVPVWLAEGLAQYGSMRCGFDTLDTHREMLLKEAWNSGNLAPLKAMETHSADSRASEMNYNLGFHFVDYLYRTFGSAAMNAMMEAWDSRGYAGSFRTAFGATPGVLYAEWRAQLDIRFTNSDARPETLPFFGPAYTVEDAPVYDSVTQTLYSLSSEANDFGITHLYATSGQTRRLVQFNVEPPLHLSPDGSLLYTAVRLDLKTGARFSDLYRYRPHAQSAERLTKRLRVVAGIEGKNKDIYAIIRRSGKTVLALLIDGWIAQTLNAPPGTELMDLAIGDDSTLYVCAARGNNTDIFRLDLNSRTFTPILASRHNERDPFVRNGRLYFSSDADGSYAIYSLQGDVITRHSAPGPSAFAPSTDGRNLRYSAYTPRGFLLRSQPLDSGTVLATVGPPVNNPFPLPETPTLSFPSKDRTRLQIVGYSASLGIAQTLHYDYYDGNTGDTIRYNPCARQGFAGGSLYGSDPQGENSVSAGAALGQCLQGASQLYSPLVFLQYLNRNFGPDFFLQGVYTGLPVRLLKGSEETPSLAHDFSGQTGLAFSLGDYFYDIPMFLLGVSYHDPNSSDYSPYSAFEAGGGNTLGFRVIDPGVDFINRGALGSAGLFALLGSSAGRGGGGLIAQTDLELHGNISRFLFLTARGQWVGAAAAYSHTVGTIAGDMRIPEGLTFGSVGYGGSYLESIFLHAAWSAQNTDGFSSLSLTRSTSLASQRNSYSTTYLSSPSYIYNPGISVPGMIELGLRLKTITLSSRVAVWNFGWQAPPDDLRGGYYSFSISL